VDTTPGTKVILPNYTAPYRWMLDSSHASNRWIVVGAVGGTAIVVPQVRCFVLPGSLVPLRHDLVVDRDPSSGFSHSLTSLSGRRVCHVPLSLDPVMITSRRSASAVALGYHLLPARPSCLPRTEARRRARAGFGQNRRALEAPEGRRAGGPEAGGPEAGGPEGRRAGGPEGRRAGGPEGRRAGGPEAGGPDAPGVTLVGGVGATTKAQPRCHDRMALRVPQVGPELFEGINQRLDLGRYFDVCFNQRFKPFHLQCIHSSTLCCLKCIVAGPGPVVVDHAPAQADLRPACRPAHESRSYASWATQRFGGHPGYDDLDRLSSSPTGWANTTSFSSKRLPSSRGAGPTGSSRPTERQA